MEHRCGSRRFVGATSAVRTVNGARIPVVIRNLSIGGAFIETPPGQLPRFAGVEVELVVHVRGRRITFRCPAMVVRTEPDGVGLMFDEVGPGGVASFFDWLDTPATRTRTEHERIPQAELLPMIGDVSMIDRHLHELRY